MLLQEGASHGTMRRPLAGFLALVALQSVAAFGASGANTCPLAGSRAPRPRILERVPCVHCFS